MKRGRKVRWIKELERLRGIREEVAEGRDRRGKAKQGRESYKKRRQTKRHIWKGKYDGHNVKTRNAVNKHPPNPM